MFPQIKTGRSLKKRNTKKGEYLVYRHRVLRKSNTVVDFNTSIDRDMQLPLKYCKNGRPIYINTIYKS